jgi:hypothetical protein
MKVSIASRGCKLDPFVKRWIEGRIDAALGRMSDRIDRVELVLSEDRGSVGRCRASIAPAGLPPVVAVQARIGLLAAVSYALDGAAAQAERSIRRDLAGRVVEAMA